MIMDIEIIKHCDCYTKYY